MASPKKFSPFMLTHSLLERISPSVMLPENRLAVLLQHVKQSQIDTCLYHTAASSPSLYSDHLCDRRNFPSEVALELGDFGGEIWSVRFSHDGTRLAACGSREHVKIWDTHTFSIVSVLTTGEHTDDRSKGICDISWSPDDSMIMVCSFDKHARLWDPTVRRETPFIHSAFHLDTRSANTRHLD
jgi:WD40 repeat protein